MYTKRDFTMVFTVQMLYVMLYSTIFECACQWPRVVIKSTKGGEVSIFYVLLLTVTAASKDRVAGKSE